MFIQVKSILITSNWNLLKDNIFIENNNKIDFNTKALLLYNNNLNLLKNINSDLDNYLEGSENKIKEVYFLGNIFYYLTKEKVNYFLKDGELKKELFIFFDKLKKHKILSILVPGENDNIEDNFIKIYYNKFFDKFIDYSIIGNEKNILLSSFPFIKGEENNIKKKILRNVRQKDIYYNIYGGNKDIDNNEITKIKHITYKYINPENLGKK